MYGSYKLGAIDLPVAFAAAVLLHTSWVYADAAGFGEVARQMFFGGCGAIGEAHVITVVAFVSASH